MSAWDELLDEFRALGGTADNIRLGHGKFGRGLFPIDPKQPVAIRVPDNLLVPMDDMIFEGGAPRVGLHVRTGARERSWLNRYQEAFAWGGGGRNEILRMFELAGALPGELRHKLAKELHCGAWFDEPTDEVIQRQYFRVRVIEYGGKAVVMPLIEMANYGPGPGYNTTSGIAVSGAFPGEILVDYKEEDSLGLFLAFGFVVQRPLAFSMPLKGTITSAPLTVRRECPENTGSERDLIPKFVNQAGEGVMTFLMLGHEEFPRLSKGIFFKLMREAGYTGFEETFDVIHHLNRLHFIKLLDALEGVDLPMAATLRSMARHQLRALSFCCGVREI